MPEGDGDEMLCHLKVRKADPGLIMAKVSAFHSKKFKFKNINKWFIISKYLHLGECEWRFSQRVIQISERESGLGRWTRS